MPRTPTFICKVLLGLAASLAAFAQSAAQFPTVKRDGFANMVLTDGTSFVPRNPISRAKGGDDVIYWIQWNGPVPHSTLRCVITGPDTNLDDTENFASAEPGGYSVCGMETDDSDGGVFTFTQYLNGEKVGEKSITIDKQSFFGNLSLRKKWKWLVGALAGIILLAYWIRRKMTGDKRSLSAVMGGEAPDVPKKPGARGSVSIGSMTGPASGNLPPLATAPKVDPAEELARKLETFKRSLAVDPAFRLSKPEDVLPIAKAARAAGDPQIAVAALRGFDKINPGHALIPDVYLLSAKVMAEDLDNKDMARKILQHVLAKYPGHYLAQEAKRYLESLT
ncbi:tetratricopeptide repeat protein [Usitatibacter palustris]|uniref:Tetratricopeptide repeat-containing protein n=1 Tax=Usitatibacter palustris TaxID=2732487 RepID=A0A6M4H9D3_9PROT|nr:hypothetical protein [Usitatibacter palustris]QJR16176.1 hypothetical protein DSM104440_03005 [Usitatibacter palustris]